MSALVAAPVVLGAGLAGPATTVPIQAQGSIRTDNDHMQFLDATEDAVAFEWAVDVVNGTSEEARVRVILELLDDDERVVNRDSQGRNQDFQDVTVGPGERRRVTSRGRMAYDVAANVVLYRVRWERLGG